MSLLFNMLSRFVITFLPRNKHLLISWVKSPSTVILEHKKIKSVTASTFPPSIYHEVLGPDSMILVFWMLNFNPTFSLSSFTLIKRLFSFSSFSAIRVVSSAYLRLLIFLPAILIPACDSSSLAFHMMYKLQEMVKDREARCAAVHGVTKSQKWMSDCTTITTEYIMQNTRLDESQAGIKTARRNTNNLRYADDTTLMAESEELKSLWMRVKEEHEKLA